MSQISVVLILVVVDDGLVPIFATALCLRVKCLNPCCSGRWSRTATMPYKAGANRVVLILVVVDDGLVLINLKKIKYVHIQS